MSWRPHDPYLTADLPGVGGRIKRHDADFVVEEIPRYPACGKGTHVYFTIEKRGLTTLTAIERIARALGKRPHDIGYAGLKDAHAVTRQWLSVEHVEPKRVASLKLDRVTVLATVRHTNKIKLGHLAGNRFTIRVRGAERSPLDRASRIVDELARRGVPSYFGPQRFGVRGDNAAIGRAVLADDYDEAVALILGRPRSADRSDAKRARELFESGDLPGAAAAWRRGFPEQAKLCRALVQTEGDARTAWRAVHHALRKLYVSALQSELFNRVLARRISGIDRIENGDIAWKHNNGACFHVDDAATEQPRCASFEISPTGPLFGRRMTDPTGEPRRIEEAALSESGISRDALSAKGGARLDGARRPLRVPLLEPAVEVGADEHGPFLRLAFALPPGAYATSAVREVTKRVEGGCA